MLPACWKVTPACVVGRIMDFIESGKLATDAVKFFVLDEADRLLDSGSQDLVMKLFSKLPKAATGTQRLQVCFPPPQPAPLPTFPIFSFPHNQLSSTASFSPYATLHTTGHSICTCFLHGLDSRDITDCMPVLYRCSCFRPPCTLRK